MTDPFDLILVSSVTVMLRDASETADAYGTSDPTFTAATPGTGPFGTSVNPAPCRVSLGKGRAKEFKAEKKEAINYREIFIRPWYDENGDLITPHHWLQITGAGPDGTDKMYQIFQVDNPSGLNHHLELWCELYQP